MQEPFSTQAAKHFFVCLGSFQTELYKKKLLEKIRVNSPEYELPVNSFTGLQQGEKKPYMLPIWNKTLEVIESINENEYKQF